MSKIVLLYFFIVNAAGFLLMLVDKRKAQYNLWRIPESTLFLVAAIGGSIGCLYGMFAFRHKTKHLKFTLGIPAIMVVQLVVLVLLML